MVMDLCDWRIPLYFHFKKKKKENRDFFLLSLNANKKGRRKSKKQNRRTANLINNCTICEINFFIFIFLERGKKDFRKELAPVT